MAEAQPLPDGVDPTRPSPARMYDFMLGGTHNLEIDRQATQRIHAQVPDLFDGAWANRGFHGRAARWLAAERGIRQFIDIGSGLPTQQNTHEVVHAVDPAARVVYVDSDPMVLLLGGEMLADDGTTAVLHADLREVDTVLNHPDLRALIDFGEPAAVLMTAVLHFVPDAADPWGLVARYLNAFAPGSYLALSHTTRDKIPANQIDTVVQVYKGATESVFPRSLAEVERFFDGLEIVPPYPGAGPVITHAGLWGAEDPQAADSDGARAFYCGVARRP
ncbi:MAG: SAM-dependent methyltransferase [Streptosporangiaceae bacterium]